MCIVAWQWMPLGPISMVWCERENEHWKQEEVKHVHDLQVDDDEVESKLPASSRQVRSDGKKIAYCVGGGI